VGRGRAEDEAGLGRLEIRQGVDEADRAELLEEVRLESSEAATAGSTELFPEGESPCASERCLPASPP
jgi:hypothetical protein